MARVFAAASLCLLLTGPAWAQGDPGNSNGPGQGDNSCVGNCPQTTGGGPVDNVITNVNMNTNTNTSASTSAAASSATNANTITTTGGNASATGGNATGGNAMATGGNATGGTSWSTSAGGVATSSAVGGGGGNAASSQTVNIEGDRTPRQTPPAFAPNLTSGDDTCMGSHSFGLSTPFVGFSGGETEPDEHCRMLKATKLLQQLGEDPVAKERACADPEIRAAFLRAGRPCYEDRAAAAQAAAASGQPVAPVQAEPIVIRRESTPVGR